MLSVEFEEKSDFNSIEKVWAVWSGVQGYWTLSTNGGSSTSVCRLDVRTGWDTDKMYNCLLLLAECKDFTPELHPSFWRGMFSISCRQFWLCSLLQPVSVSCIAHPFICSCLCSLFPTASNFSFPLIQILYFSGIPSSPFSSLPQNLLLAAFLLLLIAAS